MLGTGTAENPYLVSTEDDLFNIRLNPLANYKLTNDIYMTKWQISEGWNPIPYFGDMETSTTYTIDGDGYTVHDLYINRGGEVGVGFIREMRASVVKNIKFKNVNIVGGSATGAVAGIATGLMIEVGSNRFGQQDKAWAGDILGVDVTGTIRGTQGNLGGVVGRISDVKYDLNCKVDMTIIGSGTNVGGIVGSAYGGSHIYGSYTKGLLIGGTKVGGFVGAGRQGECNISTSYSLMDIEGTDNIGGMVGYTNSSSADWWANRIEDAYFAGTMKFEKKAGVTVSGVQAVGDSDIYRVLIDYEKLGFKFSDNNSVPYTIHKTRARTGNLFEKTTAEMGNIMTYINAGFAYGTVWLEDGVSKLDTIKFVSEVITPSGIPFSELELEGAGTEESPYLIKDYFDLLSLERYDAQNWQKYSEQINRENDWNSPEFKANYVFSSPPQFHYQLANDIDLNIYPFNETGWIPLFQRERVLRDRRGQSIVGSGISFNTWFMSELPLFYTYNSLGQRIGARTLSGRELDYNEYTYNSYGTGFVRKGFMGILNGNGYKIKNLKLNEFADNERISFIDLVTGGTLKDIVFDNVLVNVDYQKTKKVVDSGIVVHTLQNATLEKVVVNGNSFIQDYQSDVGGSRSKVAGLFFESKYVDNDIYAHFNRPSLVNKCVINVKNTFTNAFYGDIVEGFYPLAYILINVKVDELYSSSSNEMVDRFNMPIEGMMADAVLFWRTGNQHFTYQLVSATLSKVYYDSNIIKANLSLGQTMTSSGVTWNNGETGFNPNLSEYHDFQGRTTESLKFQSTYTEWDFDRTWQVDGINYPTLQPYDPNYIEPVVTIERVVTTQLDGMNFTIDRNGINRDVQTRVVNSTSRRIESSIQNVRSATSSPITILQPISVMAFEWKTPKSSIQAVATNIESFDFTVQSLDARKRNNTLETAFFGIESSVIADGINKGIYFNGIAVESIGEKSFLLKINDSSIHYINVSDSIGYRYFVPSSKYITVNMDSSRLNIGDNTVEIIGKNIDDEEVYTKVININKAVNDFGDRTGDSVFINDEYYDIQSHSTSDNVLTLSRNLSTDANKFLEDGTFNEIELVGYSAFPKFSVGGRGHQAIYTEGNLINSKRNSREIEEEYEFIAEGEEISTRIDFQRILPALDYYENGFETKYVIVTSRHYLEDYSAMVNALKTLGGTTYKNEITAQGGGLASQSFRLDIDEFIKNKVDSSYYNNGTVDVQVNFRWYGKTYHQKETFAQASEDGNTTFTGGAITKLKQSVNGSIGKLTEMTLTTKGSYADFAVEGQYVVGQYAEGDGARVITAVGVETDYIEFDILVKTMNREQIVLSEVVQVFIPKENNRIYPVKEV